MFDENKEIAIAVNGEIYNFLRLKKELIDIGYNFHSNSDSEIVLHGYKEWGIEKLLERIEGMYAFVIFDKTKNKLFLVRDRVGIKPLYYSFIDSQLAWSSELKAIQLFYNDRLSIDYTALYDFLTYRYIPTPKTLYHDVYKLAPAHYLEFDFDGCRYDVKSYWQLEFNKREPSLDEAAENLRALIQKSVKEQLISDVPIGFFLSGGLDSSTVVAEATNVCADVNTYSIGFDVKSHDETHYADIVARTFKTSHRKKILDYNTTIRMYDKIKEWYDEPFEDTSAFPTFLVSRFAKKHSTVVLTGDGGDEIFGGYNWYKRIEYVTKWRDKLKAFKSISPVIGSVRNKYRKAITGRVANKIQPYFLNDFELYARLLGGILHNEKIKYRNLWEIPADYDDYWYFRKFWRQDLPLLTRLQYLDFHTYLHDDILTKVDRVSMAVALEARVPLLATDLVLFAFSLPENIRYHNGQLKGLMKYAYKDILPERIIQRGKKGFSIPHWGGRIAGKQASRQEKVLEIFGLLR
jgi:asparagine synthase (glutamine-hydrolysing)